MRLVLLTTNLARGGAENQVAQLAIALRERGWDVSVVSLIRPTAWMAELHNAGVPVFSAGIARVPTVLRRMRPEVLHCHMFHANLLGRILRLICPIPVVISTIHSVAETSRTSEDVRWRDRLYRVTDRLADVTVAVSKAAAERHESAGAAREIRVIPNGIRTACFRSDAAERQRVRSELGVGGEFVWLAAGRLMWKKDYPTLLEAFRHIGSGLLIVAGAGPDGAILRAAAPANVRFLGPREDIPALMNAVDAFVLSSIVEGLPMALLEAGASGLPAVATDVGGVRETGIPVAILPPGDPQALAAAMQRVMSMPADERRRIAGVIRENMLKRFDMDVIVDAWESLYRKLWT